MATTASHSHAIQANLGATPGGSSAAASLPAITHSNSPVGPGGSTSPLGRERSSLTSLGGPPRKEMSYASSTASKISIATLPLDALEHIIDDFKAHGAKHGLAGRSGGGPTVRINTNSTATASGSGGGGCAARSSTRSWNPVAGSAAALAGAPSRRSHGNLGSLSFSFEGKPVTPAAGASGSGSGPGSLPGALVQQPVLPGLPPGAPITLSNRAAAVLQVPESAAHLQRFIALDATQLQNHFIISTPSGALITNLQELFDDASSIDGLPPYRETVVVLTTTPEGLPVPRTVPVDQPGLCSLRRAGGFVSYGGFGSGLGFGMTEAQSHEVAVKLNGCVPLVVASGAPADGGGGVSVLMYNGMCEKCSAAGSSSGGLFTRGGSTAITGGTTPIVPLSPQHSVGTMPRVGGVSVGCRTPRRSDTGVSRGGTARDQCPIRLPSATQGSKTMSPPLRSATGTIMSSVGNCQSPTTLPVLTGDLTSGGGGGDGGGGGGSSRRSVLQRRGSASTLVRREGSGDVGSGTLPVLVRTNSPDLGASAEAGNGGDGCIDSAGASPTSGTATYLIPGAAVTAMHRSSDVTNSPIAQTDLSPTRSRLHARIATLHSERSNNQLQQQQQQALNQSSSLPPTQRHPSPLQPRPGGGVGSRVGITRGVALSALSGMDLVRAALKQVEHGERTLTDNLFRITSPRVSETSRSASQSAVLAEGGGGEAVGSESSTIEGGEEARLSAASAVVPLPSLYLDETAAASEEVARVEEEEREAAEKRQARLVRSLTMLLTTGRGDSASRPSSALSQHIRRSSGGASNDDDDDADDEVGSSDPADDLDMDAVEDGVGDGEGGEPSRGARGGGNDEQRTKQQEDVDASQRPSVEESTTAQRPRLTREAPPVPQATMKMRHNQPSEAVGSRSTRRSTTRMRHNTVGSGSRHVIRTDAGGGAGGDGQEDSLEAAAAIAAGGGLDPQALMELAQHLDQANEEFRLVEAARERARRLEALMTQAQIASTKPRGTKRRTTGDGSSTATAVGSVGEGCCPVSPDRLPLELYMLSKRREGMSYNVTQIMSGMEAPLDRPMEVDLDQLLASIGEALVADELDVQATRFDDTFRIRTERYLSQLCRMNPIAFEEVSAAQAEADYRSSVERAKLRLKQLHGEVAGEPLTSAGKPRNQYDKAVVMLQAHRPFFLPPVMQREVVERAPVPPVLGGRGFTRPAWDVNSSIFRERKRSDARDVYDNDAVLAAQFQLDWSRISNKMLFMKLVAREDLGVRGKSGRQALEQELCGVRDVLQESFGLIRSAFTYYSTATPQEVYAAALSAAVATAAASGASIETAAAEIAANFTAATMRRAPPPPAAAAVAGPGGSPAIGTATATAPTSAGGGSSTSATSGGRTSFFKEASVPSESPPSLADSERAMVAAAAAAAAATAAIADAAADGYGILEMDEQRWLAFCTSSGITGRTLGSRMSDLRAIFWIVNREEEKNQTSESVANNDFAFMRFEFVEALVRAAYGRYITTGALHDASDATRKQLLHLRTALPPIARVDPNDFRRNRLYTADMEVAIVHNLELLTAIFKLYKARDRAKYLGIDHWMSFLETNHLMASHMGGISATEARLMFAWSQMVVVDELKLRRRAVSLQLWDFVEAVARLSERVGLPTIEDMDKWMLYNLNIGRHTPLPPGLTRVYTYCSALAAGRGVTGLESRLSSRELLSSVPPTRPLAVKFRALMEYLAGSLAVAWGGSNSHGTAQSMMRTANMLCGGVELA